jgi:hypothetical protein
MFLMADTSCRVQRLFKDDKIEGTYDVIRRCTYIYEYILIQIQIYIHTFEPNYKIYENI